MQSEQGHLTLRRYKRDVVIKERLTSVRRRRGGGLRRPISSFSGASRRRFFLMAFNADVPPLAWLHLTYGDSWPPTGLECKRQLNRFLTKLRRRHGRDRAYLWNFEFQRRGAPHFSVLVDCFVDHRDVAKWWGQVSGNWSSAATSVSGLLKHERIVLYMAKVLHDVGKLDQKEVPVGYQNVGRWWGCSRSYASYVERPCSLEEYRVYREYCIAHGYTPVRYGFTAHGAA